MQLITAIQNSFLANRLTIVSLGAGCRLYKPVELMSVFFYSRFETAAQVKSVLQKCKTGNASVLGGERTLQSVGVACLPAGRDSSDPPTGPVRASSIPARRRRETCPEHFDYAQYKLSRRIKPLQ